MIWSPKPKNEKKRKRNEKKRKKTQLDKPENSLSNLNEPEAFAFDSQSFLFHVVGRKDFLIRLD